MKPGVRLIEEKAGTGRIAEPPLKARVRLKMMLNRGEVIFPAAAEQVVDLGARHTIAGLRYGIEGMRVGGWRTVQVSPHLAYGAEGLPEVIPPEAALRFEIELLEVHTPDWQQPGDRKKRR